MQACVRVVWQACGCHAHSFKYQQFTNMKKHYLYSALAAAALALAACSSLPKLPANLQAGVDANNPEAFLKAGLYYDKLENASNGSKWAKSAELYRKGAELGDAGCQNELGYAYEKGAGVPMDYGQARAWFSRAAEQNHAGALNNLGYLYDHGIGVPVNYAVAKNYYERSRTRGSTAALNNLGVMYTKGHGVRVDKSKALKLFEQAAAMGNSLAKDNASALRREMAIQSPASVAGKRITFFDDSGKQIYTYMCIFNRPFNYGNSIMYQEYNEDFLDGTKPLLHDKLTYNKTGQRTATVVIVHDNNEDGRMADHFTVIVTLTITSPTSGTFTDVTYGYHKEKLEDFGSGTFTLR